MIVTSWFAAMPGVPLVLEGVGLDHGARAGVGRIGRPLTVVWSGRVMVVVSCRSTYSQFGGRKSVTVTPSTVYCCVFTLIVNVADEPAGRWHDLRAHRLVHGQHERDEVGPGNRDVAQVQPTGGPGVAAVSAFSP